MKHLVMATLFFFSALGNAQANELRGTCEISKKYFKENMRPQQTINLVRAEFDFDKKELSMSLKRKNDSTLYFTGSQHCPAISENSYRCNVDGDGGTVLLTFNFGMRGNIELQILSPLKVEDESGKEISIVPRKNGDDYFIFQEFADFECTK